MKLSLVAKVLLLAGFFVVLPLSAAWACEDDWMQVRQAVGPADQTRARLSRDMRVGFDEVVLGQALSTIQARTGVAIVPRWDELGAYGLTRSTPIRMLPWKVMSGSKALHEMLEGKIKDRPVLSIDPDGRVRIPGVKLKAAVPVAGGEGAGPVAVVVNEDAVAMPESGEVDAGAPLPDVGTVAGAEGAATQPAGGEAARDAVLVDLIVGGGATQSGNAENPKTSGGPAGLGSVGSPGGSAMPKAPETPGTPETPAPGKKISATGTGLFVEVLPLKEAQAPVTENDRLIGALIKRGVRFNPAAGGTGWIVKVSPGVLSDELLAQVVKVKGVVELHVGDCSGGRQVSDAGLRSIGTMKGLTGLSLRQSGVTAEGLKEIGKLTNLTWLDFAETKLGRQEMEMIAGLPKLESLRLNNMGMTAENLAVLGGSRSLKSLWLDVKMNMDEWSFTFEALEKFAGLEELSFAPMNSSVMERGLSKLKLKRITLTSNATTDEHLELIAQIKTLEGVTLYEPIQVTGAGFGALVKLPRLSALRVTGVGEEAALAPIGKIKTLQKLDLGGVKASGISLAWVAGLTNLKELTLPRGRFGDEDLLKLKGLVNLELLYVSMNGNITDKGVGALEGMSKLQKLYLCGTNVSNASLPTLAKLKALTRLDICHTKVDDEGVAALAGLPKLEELSLGGKNTDRALELLAQVKSLRLLEIKGSLLTAGGLNRLRVQSPELRIKSWG